MAPHIDLHDLPSGGVHSELVHCCGVKVDAWGEVTGGGKTGEDENVPVCTRL